MTYTIEPRKVTAVLALLASYLAVQSLLSEYLLETVLSDEVGSGLISLIDILSVNVEASIPTWYATLLLFGAAVLLAVITAVKKRQQDPFANYWLGLAVLFLYLSIDEGAAIHEAFSTPLSNTFNTSGYLEFGWLILFFPLAVLFALLYIRFLRQLPVQTRNLFVVAGVLYVGGAVFVEAVSANQYALVGGVSFRYLAIATVEEMCEMAGTVLFIYALLDFIEAGRYTAVFDTLYDTQPLQTFAQQWPKRLTVPLIGAVVLLNIWLISWSFNVGEGALAERPFYETIATEYGGQGVVILELSAPVSAEYPQNAHLGTSLLTLFDDVYVVTLSEPARSFAFASSSLPFDEATLNQMVVASGVDGFELLNENKLREVSAND